MVTNSRLWAKERLPSVQLEEKAFQRIQPTNHEEAGRSRFMRCPMSAKTKAIATGCARSQNLPNALWAYRARRSRSARVQANAKLRLPMLRMGPVRGFGFRKNGYVVYSPLVV